MSRLTDQLSRLSPERRALLERTIEARGPELGVFPLSPAQERLWFLDRIEPGNPFYNVPGALRLDGELDAPVLARSLTEVRRRHESLRTTFLELDGGPRQHVEEPSPLPLPVADLSALPAGRREAEAESLVRAEVRRPFDLARGPLVRALLVRLGPRRHLLSFTLHHVIADGWSMGVLVREVAVLYAAFAAGRRSPLPEPELQYADFAVWQRERMADGRFEEQLAWWKDQLHDLVPLALPVDRPRPAAPAFRGRRIALPVGPEPTARLRELARERGVTVFMVLLSAFQALLGRVAGQEDVAVGTPVANRNRPEIEPLIGFFVNSLVLRADLAAARSFSDLVEQVRRTALAAWDRQDLPFERLVQELRPDRDLSRNPLFQVMFAVQNAPWPGLELPGLALRPVAAVGDTAKFDLQVDFWEREDRMDCTLRYDVDLFDATSVERLGRGLLRLLEAGLAAPDAPLGTLPSVSRGERQQVLVEWSDTAPGALAAIEEAATIEALVRSAAAARPAAPALEDWALEDSAPAEASRSRWTYAELVAAAEGLARRLQAAGAGAETPVALVLERSAEQVVATLAALVAGGYYVPLDPADPPARLERMLAETFAVAAAGVVVTRGGLPAGVALPAPAAELDLTDIDLAAEVPGSLPALRPAPSHPERLAYVMYTSGSTGRPKGVAVPHRAVVRLVRQAGLHGFAHLGPEETLLQLAPASFDAATLEIWGALATGGRLVVAPAGRLSLAELGEVIRSSGTTTLWLTAALFAQVVDAEPASLAGVRQLLAGGDVLPVPAVERVLAELPATRLINGYGPTENTTFTACQPIVPGSRVRPSVPIGRPIAGTGVRVLGPGLSTVAPAAVGATGELYATGEGLARGYAGQPARTAERFVPDPLAGRGTTPAGARAYATGDLVRWLADGTLEFLGRRDAQVKVRGFRVEPGEVEAALVDHPAVAEAAVVARADRTRTAGHRLVAYVVLADGTEDVASGLREWLRERLPEPMVPAGVVALDALPLTATGKIDRRALAARSDEPSDGGAATASRAPRSPIEEVVAGIWAEVLERPGVGLGDDFFALGGHSLLATRVIARIRRDFEVELPLAALFEGPTVAALARRVEQALALSSGVSAPPVEPVDRDSLDEIPLSFAQERIWFLDQLDPGNPFYVMPFPIRLHGDLDLPALAASLDAVVRRHEVLRTAYLCDGGPPRQRIAPARPLAPSVIDLAGLPGASREREAQRWIRLSARMPFDLSRAPMLRAAIVRSGPREHLLLLALHHIAADGWSTGVLLREVTALYSDLRRSRDRDAASRELPSPSVQYADFAIWQRRWLSGEALAAEVDWWRQHLAGHRLAIDLPTDRPRPPVQRLRGDRVAVTIPPALRAGIDALGRTAGATLFMTLLAAFQALLARITGDTDPLVGTPIANRRQAELEGLIGFFVNTLVLRSDLAGRPTWRRHLERSRTATLDAYAHQDLPFERLVEELQPRRDLSRHPVVQVMFSLQNAPMPPFELPGLTLETTGGGRTSTQFDLNVDVVETERDGAGSLLVLFEYDGDLFDRTTARRLAGWYRTLLAGAVAEPDRAAAELPLLSPAERHQLRHEWSGRGRPAGAPLPVDREDRDACFPALFAARAAADPHAVAVELAGETLTYRQLAGRAGALARRLRELGRSAAGDDAPRVGPEVRVALFLDRSLELAEAIVGTLFAGAAYVPLDPAYPAEQLDFMLEDSGARAVVTTADLAARLPAGAARLPRVEIGGGGDDAALEPPVLADPGQAAYVIYTSGSTGRPKGTVISHRSLATYTRSAVEALEIEPSDRVLQFAALSFDVAVEELFPAWAAGATVVLARDDRMADPASFLDLVRDERLTLFELPTAFWHEWVREIEASGGRIPETVRRVIVGGERVAPERLRHWGSLGVPLTHVYGLTETTVTSTHFRPPVGAESGERGWDLPIGFPLPASEVRVLDAELREVPGGVPGEVAIGGAFVGRGYHGRPRTTAERFVPDPHAADGRHGSRIYRTGDLARFRADGALEFLGRLDHQVKIRGFRVEPGEVEAALAAEPGVREAVVVVREVAGDRRLVGYVVTDPGREDVADGLRARLRERLPEHRVPSVVVPLAALPLSPNGKVDRSALPDPERPAAGAGAGYVAPRSEVEETLAAIFGEVLGTERVGIEDDFFDLGGHSLLAAQLIARVREAFRIELPLRRLFEAPTVAALAVAVVAVQLEQGDEDEMASALAEIEGLSDDELQALLAAEAAMDEPGRAEDE